MEQIIERAKSHYQQSDDEAIKQWLNDRQSLMVLYYKLCVSKPKTYNSYTANLMLKLSQLLLDYVSAGHFDIFEKIAASRKSKSLDHSLMQNILRTTNIALDFSDKYDNNQDYSQLCDDLSSLGESLATRFDWEDKLIDLYFEAKKH